MTRRARSAGRLRRPSADERTVSLSHLSKCITDTSTGHSALLGYAFDGFGIYGLYGESGKELTNADLDECHGHTHVIRVGRSAGGDVSLPHDESIPLFGGMLSRHTAVQGPIGAAGRADLRAADSLPRVDLRKARRLRSRKFYLQHEVTKTLRHKAHLRAFVHLCFPFQSWHRIYLC